MTLTESPRDDAPAQYPVRIDAAGAGCFAWRLTAANGRSLGRSAETFPSAQAARSALHQLVTSAGSQPLSGSIGHRPGGWGWTVTDEQGRAVAHSPRTFERHGSCARSLIRFRAALDQLPSR